MSPLRSLVLLVFVTPGCVIAYDVETDEGATGTGTAGSDTDPMCETYQTQCGSSCVDLERDPDHCGVCDNVCAIGMACDRGECRETCRDGRELCDRYCVDLDIDPSHCGACNVACLVDEVCIDAVCEVS